jgi:hypothetical protein
MSKPSETSSWFVEELGAVSVAPMVKWIKAIPFDEWPQQSRLADGKIRPSMVTDESWHGFRDYIYPLMLSSDTCYQPMLSVVMPGHSIEPHKDQQPDYWKYRVHIPLVTNAKAVTIMDDGRHNLKVGKAYKLNVRATHAIENFGRTPRIHFMFDVK